MALLNFKYGLQANLPAKAVANAGNVYITTDTKKMFVELPTAFSGNTVTATQQYCIADFQLVSWTKTTDVTGPSAALGNLALKDTNTLYLTVESASGATAMWRYNGSSFVAISNSEEIASIVTDIDTLKTAVSELNTFKNTTVPQTYMPKAGGTFTGNVSFADNKYLTVHAPRAGETGKDDAAPRQYVDGAESRIMGSASGTSTSAATVYDVKRLAQAAKDTADSNNTNLQNLKDVVEDTSTGLATKAPINHASTDTTYGAASTSQYGHVKLSSAVNSDSESLGATPKAVKAAYQQGAQGIADAKDAKDRADEAHTLAAGKAPISHAVNDNTYGLGTNGVYGHVKLSDDTNGTAAAASGGTAATPKAVADALTAAKAHTTTRETAILGEANYTQTVKSAYEKAAEAASAASKAQQTADGKANKSHASTSTEYGAGTDSNYGHVKLSDAIDTAQANGAASKSIAASSYAVNSLRTTLIGTDADKADALTIKGAKQFAADKVSEVASDLSTLEGKIGNLSNIMNFLGATTTQISDGSTTNPITVGGKSVTAVAGDVVISGNKEFVFGDNKWAEIGDVSAQATAIKDLQDTVGTRPSTPTMDNTLWEEVADLRTDLGESGASAGTTTAFARIKSLEEWKSTHSVEYVNLEGRVDNLEGWQATHTGLYNTLKSVVDGHTDAIGKTNDAASATGSIYARIKQNYNDINNSTNGLKKRVTDLEGWKSTHESAYTTLSGTVGSNTTAINNLTTLLTWGTF